jgi:DNA-binding MarR family transcriptional regulator
MARPPDLPSGEPRPRTADTPQLDLERFLPYRLSVLSNRISDAIARAYRERFGLGVTEWRVMAVLGRYPGLAAGAVAQRTAMDKVAVSRAVARLLARGLLARDTHGDDRRRSVLALSAAGRRVHDQVVPLALAYERELLAPLDPAERTTLARLLSRLDIALAAPGVAAAPAPGAMDPPE